MSKQLLQGMDAVKKLQTGANKLIKAVSITLGPKGRNVVLDRKFATPLITNDGVTIAKEITLPDPFENMGANLVKEVSIKTNDVAGDGTTTAAVLAGSIINNGIKNFAAGANPIILKRGIKKATDVVINTLQEISTPVNNSQDIYNIASISAGSEEVGNLICQAFSRVGKDGVILAEDGKTFKTELKVVEGLQFDRGFLSHYMATNLEKLECELTSCFVLLAETKIENIAQILPVLEKVNSTGKPLLIIADEIENDVIATLVLNKLRGTLNCAAVKSPAYGDRRKALMQDIAVLTGATVISPELGTALKDIDMQTLGRAQKIIINRESTTITGGMGDPLKLTARVNSIKAQIATADNDFDKDGLSERLAKLTGGVAVISVGSTTEVEMQELKLRIEDAVSATKSAVAGGIVPGGGVALLKCIPAVEQLVQTLLDDEKIGAQIVLQSLTAPIEQIAENAGVNGGVVTYNILNNKIKPNYGYNALNNTYGNMIEEGIIDPTLVTVTAMQNAASVASTMLTTEVLVADIEEPNKPITAQQAANGYGIY